MPDGPRSNNDGPGVMVKEEKQEERDRVDSAFRKLIISNRLGLSCITVGSYLDLASNRTRWMYFKYLQEQP